MSAPQFAQVPGQWFTPKPVSFIAADGTRAKVVVELTPEQAAVGVQAPFQGGCSIFELCVSSTDGANKDLLLWLGKVLTTQGAGTSGNITLSAQNLLTRVSGSFVADGWLPGDKVMAFAPPGTVQSVAAFDGVEGIVTAVAALTVTVTGTPWPVGSHVLTAGSRLVNISQLFRTQIPLNSGNVAGTRNVSLIGNGSDASVVATEFKLGADALLLAGMGSAVAALPAAVMVQSRGAARY